eukprot:6205334-Pleurochrysis_carterae.AAC.1
MEAVLRSRPKQGAGLVLSESARWMRKCVKRQWEKRSRRHMRSLSPVQEPSRMRRRMLEWPSLGVRTWRADLEAPHVVTE